ncbi:hypothetical protein ASC94_02150 [Massilia sp. Root418]|nr:hypothetical protein ASC94_02150 [Massilia sp. Root418]
MAMACLLANPGTAAAEPVLELNTQTRLRYDSHNNAQLTPGNDYRQGLFRGVLGANLQFSPGFGAYAEVGTGQVAGRRTTASANFQNAASLQQLYVKGCGNIGGATFGVQAGRQEFADGPRQLLSPGDGPNLHRSWNGVRMSLKGERWRIGAYGLRATKLARGALDEEVNHGERLRGLNVSLTTAAEKADGALDAFWIHSRNPALRSGRGSGVDERDTAGLRRSGKRGRLRYDWTVAHQGGHYQNREVSAWALFAVQSLELSGSGWKPRMTARIDVASGGGTYQSGTLRAFNQLYASSAYLGEGQFLGLSNLLMVSPGLSLAPARDVALSAELGLARRLKENEAAYAGGMRAYAGTQNVPGRAIGSLFRLSGTWTASEHLTVNLNVERLAAGDVLKRAKLPSGSYVYIGATMRY